MSRSLVFRRAVAIACAVATVALAARVSFSIPGAAVPQSLQTLAVVVVGAVLGPGLGGVAMLLYVLVGALGAPVFADGAAGLEVVLGPSFGYLVGFVVAAMMMGCAMRRTGSQQASAQRLATLVSVSLAAHALILFAGAARLSLIVGWSEAVASGALPFWLGALVKSVLAALLLEAFNVWSSKRKLPLARSWEP